jgi:hypothetical protein
MDDLDKKDANIETLAQKALFDKNLLQELLEGVFSKNHTIRSNSFQVLTLLSDERGEFLYLKWEYFQEMLASSNSYHKNIAITILANLTKVDVDNNSKQFLKIIIGYLLVIRP